MCSLKQTLFLILCSCVLGELKNRIKCPNVTIHAKKFSEFYLAMNGSGAFGLFPPLMRNISKVCCSGHFQIKFKNETSDVSVQNLLFTERRYGHKQDSTNITLKFYFPAYSTEVEASTVYKEFYFIEIMKSPGPAFIMLTEEIREAPDPVIILVECWPIFLLLIIMACVVGILAWFFDHRKNSEQFPKNFYWGSWSGFWWAMVTMTTVGYGDKAPISFAARVLTILWMIAGTIVTSLFTANVTTVLTTRNVAALQNTLGQKVGVLNSKHFFQREINEGASFVEFQDQKSLIEAFYSKKVSRILVPNYLDHLYFVTANKVEKDFIVTNVIKHPFSVGLGLVNDVTDNKELIDLLRCWERSIVHNNDESGLDYSIIDPSSFHGIEQAKSLLNQNSILTLVYGLIALLVLFFAVGSMWELWKYRNHTGKMDTMAPNELEMTRKASSRPESLAFN